jgi:hypothetical protein
LFNTKCAIFQLYHGANKLHFKEKMMTVPEMAGPKKKFGASKILVTGPNGIMVAQTFCDITIFCVHKI